MALIPRTSLYLINATDTYVRPRVNANARFSRSSFRSPLFDAIRANSSVLRALKTRDTCASRSHPVPGLLKKRKRIFPTCTRVVSKVHPHTSIRRYDTIRGECNFYRIQRTMITGQNFRAMIIRSRATRIIYYNYPHVGMSSLLVNSSSHSGAFNSRRSFGT